MIQWQFRVWVCLLLLAGCARGEEPAFVQGETAWRAARDAEMRAPTSWLTIAGLFWLEEGPQIFGTAPSCTVRLPEGSAPTVAGTLTRSGGTVSVAVSDGVGMLLDGEPVTERVLRSDARGRADLLILNDLQMWIIERGDRIAVRLRDLNEPRFLHYEGLDFYPPRSTYRIQGVFVPYSEPREHTVSTVVGTTTRMRSPGYVSFSLHGQELTLEAFEGPDEHTLYFVFRDATSGEETYGAGRFLYASMTEDGEVDLNFNRAHNPPCGYTPYATCPLPLPENILSVPIEAGEKIYPCAAH